MNFWKILPKPFIGLSPMDGVSDAAFRYITAKYGKPDVITTEFISVDGVLHAAETLFKDFWYSDIERPIVAQIFGIEPELFYLSAQIIAELGFDGVDINMGCPAKTVSRRGAGAGLISNPELAKQIIAATKQGVKDWQEKGIDQNINDKLLKQIELTIKEIRVEFKSSQRKLLPVSVKTRIGYENVEVEKWIPEILCMDVQNITVHGRTLKQMYQGEANWDALYVYHGNAAVPANLIASANGAGNVPGGLAGGYWGTTIPCPFTSADASGCLTFVFRSDGSGTFAGWASNITCRIRFKATDVISSGGTPS